MIKLKRIIFTSLFIIIFLSLYLNGWMEAEQTWQAATGYDSIPEHQQPELSAKISLSKYDTEVGDEGPLIYWLGHSGFYISWKGKTILTDPNLNSICTTSKRKFPAPVRSQDLPHIDLVLLSHSHFDHMDLPTLTQIPSISHIITPTGTLSALTGSLHSATQLHELNLAGSFRLGSLTIHAVEAKHNGGRLHPFKSGTQALGYVITDGDISLYYAGDTGFGDHFLDIKESHHPDIAILPIGAYIPRIPLKYYHLNPEETVAAAKLLGVSLVFPCHFGTFQLSLDHPSSALPRFAKRAFELQLPWQMAPLYDL